MAQVQLSKDFDKKKRFFIVSSDPLPDSTGLENESKVFEYDAAMGSLSKIWTLNQANINPVTGNNWWEV